ncbi:MAG: helix-turn-helix domain-containing protein [Burkholderiales bacterium]|jgi:AcrR family transcriptional regulator
MALLPLRQAAEAVGVSRQTLYRYVKEGRISATVGHDGQKQVDTAELLRVFGKLDTPPAGATAETAPQDSPRQPETAGATAVTAAETARLEAELAAARTLLDVTRTELTAAREREAKLLDIVQTQTRMLEYRPPDKPVDTPASSPTAPWITLAVVVVAALLAAAWLASSRPPMPPAPPSPPMTTPNTGAAGDTQ